MKPIPRCHAAKVSSRRFQRRLGYAECGKREYRVFGEKGDLEVEMRDILLFCAGKRRAVLLRSHYNAVLIPFCRIGRPGLFL
jgi:hypothetical protein